MDKNEYEGMVGRSNLCQTAKLLILAYLHHCKQQELKEVWPSLQTVAEWAGVGRDTASKYVAALVEAGWLVPAQMHEPRLQGYEFGEAVAEPIGILAKPVKHVSDRSKQNLKVGRDRPVAEPIGAEVTDSVEAVAESAQAVAESPAEQLPNEVVPVADSTSAGKEENNNLEKTKEKSVAHAPQSPFAGSTTDSLFVPSTHAADGDVPSPVAAVNEEEEEEEVIWGWTEDTVRTLLKQKDWKKDDIARSIITWKYDYKDFDGDGDTLEKILKEELESETW